ncbi:hypothetical protein LCGC14_0810690 [marine sediment metagenome]|uniref:Uncharacterized protein n=1 Tax=marine sediment metagenome TaxID=412755 RepID=A0A0F9S6W8_9ZZZZ|nr:MAG: hypothetical protein Lokiarch_11330 [Candidatus Lokiarchaeum sp. GC14_75]
MTRTELDLNYLKNTKPIKKYLIDTPLTPKKIRTYLLSTDKIFPYLANKFKDNIEELNNIDLLTFLSKSGSEKNKITQEWDKTDINNKVFESWKKETPETKSNILMKFVVFCVEQEEKKDDTKRKTKENTFLSYIWSFQGLMANLGRDYEANPKKLQQLKQNGIKIGSDIEYSEVVELYDKLTNEKYKIILRIMMYSGLNPIDILQFKPSDFIEVNGSIKKKLNKELKDTDFYYVNKQRTKTERKNISFLLVFAEHYFNEIKNYFERPIIININKNGSEKTNKKIKNLTNETYVVEINKKKVKKNRYTIELDTENTIRFVGKYHWDYDKNVNLFGTFNPKSTTNVADAFSYCVEKHGLNEHLKPYNIRSLCFTLLKDVFTFKDENIYQVWTQHKIKGLVDRNYITNTMDTLINKYLHDIEEVVLIGSLKQTLEKANEYKEKADAVSDNAEDIIELKLENNKLLTMLNKSKKEMDDLKAKFYKMSKDVSEILKNSTYKHTYGS